MPSGVDKTSKKCSHCPRVFSSGAGLALHLRAVNGLATSANTKKTHCPYGHEYTLENTLIAKAGDRRCRECQGVWNRKSKYGLERGQYEKMFVAQKGRCLLCKKRPKGGRRLSVDHSHSTGEVRGLLCVICNRMISVVESVGIAKIERYLT